VASLSLSPLLPQSHRSLHCHVASVEMQSQRFEEEHAEGEERKGQEELPLWSDDETRSFYEDLVDLSEIVPAHLLRAKRDDSEAHPEEESEAEAGEHSLHQNQQQAQQQKSNGKAAQQNAEKLFGRLPKCTSKDGADHVSIDFAKAATRSLRKRIVRCSFPSMGLLSMLSPYSRFTCDSMFYNRELLNVPTKELQLIPFYARITANVSQAFKDVGQSIVSSLEDSFNQQVQKKDQIELESKLRTARFLGELCKFGNAQPATVFSCLKQCYDDFTHHNIDVACALLESCGRFLCKTRSTTTRANINLDILMRLKSAKKLDSRQSSIVDNAYYTCRPPARTKPVRSKTKEEMYIEYLLYEVLERKTVERVVAQMRKLSWEDIGEDMVVQKLLDAAVMGRSTNVASIASVVAGLSRFRDSLSVALVDDLLERVREGLEHESPSMNQERVAHMRLLAELFRVKIVPPQLVIDTLYAVLFFGHYDGGNGHAIDPPTHTLRARLVITALQGCGRSIDSGKTKLKIGSLLAHFWRYLMYKKRLPSQVKFDATTLVSSMRDHVAKSQTVEDAEAVCQQLDAQASEESQSQQLADDNEETAASENDEVNEEDESDAYESGGEGGVDLDGIDEASGARRSAGARRGASKEEERAFEEEFHTVMQELGGVTNVNKRRELNASSHHQLAEKRAQMVSDDEEEEESESDQQQTVQFKLLTRSKPSSQQHLSIELPKSSSFAQTVRQQQAQEERERRELKNLTLGLTEEEIE